MSKRDSAGRSVVRLGKHNSAVLAGDDDVIDWDDEELLRGQRRAKNGHFQGSPPKLVPMMVHKEMRKRAVQIAEARLVANLVPAVELLATVVNDENATTADRMRAAGMLIERVLGRAPEKVDIAIEHEQPLWLKTLQVSLKTEPIETTVRDAADATK